MTNLALQKNLRDVVTEYNAKVAALDAAVKTFEDAGTALRTASTIGGTWGDISLNTGTVYKHQLESGLLK